MKYVRAFGRFWYGFIIGDDWRIAAGAVLALGISAGLARSEIPAWWFLPLAVVGLIGGSLWLAVRKLER